MYVLLNKRWVNRSFNIYSWLRKNIIKYTILHVYINIRDVNKKELIYVLYKYKQKWFIQVSNNNNHNQTQIKTCFSQY